MTLLQKLKIKIGKNLIASATGRWHPQYPPEAYFHGDMSFSQCGEDLAVVNILMQLDHRGPVNYVDVGCFHPIQYSNTYFFYLNGGSGLVIDMNESHRSEFGRLRPRDKFLAEVVSDSSDPVFFSGNGSPLDSILQGKNDGKGQLRHPKALSELLEEHWPQNKQITLLDIDCEGHDFAVLKSNNWKLFRPKIVVLESFSEPSFDDLSEFMSSNGYDNIANIRAARIFKTN